MSAPSSGFPFGNIPTSWTLLHQVLGAEVVEEARNRARRELIARYGDAVRACLEWMLRQTADREQIVADLFQDWSARILEKGLPTVEPGAAPQPGRFGRYLVKMLRNRVNDHFRQRKRQPRQLPEEFEVADPPDEVERRIASENLMRRALEVLTVRQPDLAGLLRAHVLQKTGESEQTPDEIAAELGMTRRTMYRRLSEARQALWEQVQREVAVELGNPTAAEIAEELGQLGLMDLRPPAASS